MERSGSFVARYATTRFFAGSNFASALSKTPRRPKPEKIWSSEIFPPSERCFFTAALTLSAMYASLLLSTPVFAARRATMSSR